MKKNKKTIVLTIIGITAFLISVIGAAYAYFKIGVDKYFSSSSINASTAALGSVKLVSTDSNLYLNLTRSEMMEANEDKYYAVTDPNGSPIGLVTALGKAVDRNKFNAAMNLVNQKIGYIEVTGNGTYDCDYEFEVTYEGNLKEALLTEDAKALYFGLGFFDGDPIFEFSGDGITNRITSNGFGVYETEFPTTISGTLEGVNSLNRINILAKLSISTVYEQNHLINKNMKLSIKAKSFSCRAKEQEDVMVLNDFAEYLVENVSSDELWKSPLDGDGYRFVGENPNNYVCFNVPESSNEKEECLNNPDKYMYRIIGIFPDKNNKGRIKVIKDKPLDTTYTWDSSSDTDESTNLNNLKYYLTEYYYDNEPRKFVDSFGFIYVNTMTEKINEFPNVGPNYNMNTSRTVYLHELNRSSKSSQKCYYDYDNLADCNIGVWELDYSNIGLMYVSDYMLSSGENALNYRGSLNSNVMKKSWLKLDNKQELTLTRSYVSSGSNSGMWVINEDGSLEYTSNTENAVIRPVMYLKANASDSSIYSEEVGDYVFGDGSIDNPFMFILFMD